jgi:hypothetical protein
VVRVVDLDGRQVNVIGNADLTLTPEEQLERDRAIIIGNLREQFNLSWWYSDLFRLIDSPERDSNEVRDTIVYYRDNHQKERYDSYMDQVIEWNYMSVSKAKRMFFMEMIPDLMLIVSTFGTQGQLDLWQIVYNDFLNHYKDYGAQLGTDPVGFFVDTTLIPPITLATDVVSQVAEPIVTGVATIAGTIIKSTVTSIFGKDFKQKLIIGGTIVIIIIIVGLIGFQYSKVFITEKARKKAQ